MRMAVSQSIGLFSSPTRRLSFLLASINRNCLLQSCLVQQTRISLFREKAEKLYKLKNKLNNLNPPPPPMVLLIRLSSPFSIWWYFQNITLGTQWHIKISIFREEGSFLWNQNMSTYYVHILKNTPF